MLTRNGISLLSYVFQFCLGDDTLFTYIKKDGCHLQYEIIITEEHKNKDLIAAPDGYKLDVKDHIQSSFELLEFMAGAFKRSSFELIISEIPNDAIKEFLTAVNNLKITTHNLEVCGDGQWKNCREVKKLENYCETTPDFEFDYQQSFTFESCHLLNSPFLILDHLARLFWNCRVFHTDKDHKLTNQDLNQLINSWMNGGSKHIARQWNPQLARRFGRY